jgi:hypothetical protein
MGNCSAVKGKLRPANAVYPRQSASGFDRKRDSVSKVADEEDVDLIICAFCFITSAGVRMAQEMSSAREEAAEWMMGCGRSGVEWRVGLCFARRDFVLSYVVKNAPAKSKFASVSGPQELARACRLNGHTRWKSCYDNASNSLVQASKERGSIDSLRAFVEE